MLGAIRVSDYQSRLMGGVRSDLQEQCRNRTSAHDDANHMFSAIV